MCKRQTVSKEWQVGERQKAYKVKETQGTGGGEIYGSKMGRKMKGKTDGVEMEKNK